LLKNQLWLVERLIIGEILVRLLSLILFVIFAHPALASVYLNSSFAASVEPGWTPLGVAQFTGNGSIDASGQGWLRLTNTNANVTGGAFNSQAFSIAYGFDVRFEYKTWGGDGADGFALAFIDGTVTPTSLGADGGSLGYAQKTGVNGLAGAFLGIGFDEYGNFAADTEGRRGGVGRTEDAVTIRGPGNGRATPGSNNRPNYGFLATSGSLSGDTFQLSLNNASARPMSAADFRSARVIADTSQIAQGRLPVTVYLSRGTGNEVQVITYDAYAAVVAYYGSPSSIPATLRIGFTAANGGQTNRHEVRNVRVDSILNAPGYPTAVPEPGTNLLIACGLAGMGFHIQRRRKLAKEKA
jgi:hypothetical protein